MAPLKTVQQIELIDKYKQTKYSSILISCLKLEAKISKGRRNKNGQVVKIVCIVLSNLFTSFQSSVFSFPSDFFILFFTQ